MATVVPSSGNETQMNPKEREQLRLHRLLQRKQQRSAAEAEVLAFRHEQTVRRWASGKGDVKPSKVLYLSDFLTDSKPIGPPRSEQVPALVKPSVRVLLRREETERRNQGQGQDAEAPQVTRVPHTRVMVAADSAPYPPAPVGRTARQEPHQEVSSEPTMEIKIRRFRTAALPTDTAAASGRQNDVGASDAINVPQQRKHRSIPRDKSSKDPTTSSDSVVLLRVDGSGPGGASAVGMRRTADGGHKEAERSNPRSSSAIANQKACRSTPTRRKRHTNAQRKAVVDVLLDELMIETNSTAASVVDTECAALMTALSEVRAAAEDARTAYANRSTEPSTGHSKRRRQRNKKNNVVDVEHVDPNGLVEAPPVSLRRSARCVQQATRRISKFLAPHDHHGGMAASPQTTMKSAETVEEPGISTEGVVTNGGVDSPAGDHGSDMNEQEDEDEAEDHETRNVVESLRGEADRETHRCHEALLNRLAAVAAQRAVVARPMHVGFYPSLAALGIGQHPLAALMERRLEYPASGGGDLSSSSPPVTSPPPFVTHATRETWGLVQSYCNHVLTHDLDTAVFALLSKLEVVQRKLRQTQPKKFKSRIRYLTGLKEVTNSIRMDTVRVVILAPDVEPLLPPAATPGHLAVARTGRQSDMVSVHDIVDMCKVKNIPFVCSLSRKSLGFALRKGSSTVSAVAIMSANGAHEALRLVTALAIKARADYRQLVANEMVSEGVIAGN